VLSLLENGFAEEAFGLTRTLLDIVITLRYIANKDSDERANRFYFYFTKDIENWGEVVKEYFPQMQVAQRTTDQVKMIERAKAYKQRYSWSGKGTKELAFELDTLEVMDDGTPAQHEFSYTAIYYWTSQFVHPTISGLHSHIVQAGHDPFTVHAGAGRGIDYFSLSAFNVAAYLGLTMASVYRLLGYDQPTRLGTYSSAILQHIARRHRG
jgi:hypothetical protein